MSTSNAEEQKPSYLFPSLSQQSPTSLFFPCPPTCSPPPIISFRSKKILGPSQHIQKYPLSVYTQYSLLIIVNRLYLLKDILGSIFVT